MSDQRKASEVLLTLENTVSDISKSIKNLEFQQKIILERLTILTEKKNFVAAPIKEVSFPVYAEAPAEIPVAPKNLKSKLQLALEEVEKNEMVEGEEIPIITGTQPNKRRTTRFQGKPMKDRSIPVQQRITYSDGKNVYMANVEIFSSDGKLVKQTKTNQVGKWLASLQIGEYQVQITKAGSNIKPKVELSYKIKIPDQDSAVELEERKVS